MYCWMKWIWQDDTTVDQLAFLFLSAESYRGSKEWEFMAVNYKSFVSSVTYWKCRLLLTLVFLFQSFWSIIDVRRVISSVIDVWWFERWCVVTSLKIKIRTLGHFYKAYSATYQTYKTKRCIHLWHCYLSNNFYDNCHLANHTVSTVEPTIITKNLKP